MLLNDLFFYLKVPMYNIENYNIIIYKLSFRDFDAKNI